MKKYIQIYKPMGDYFIINSIDTEKIDYNHPYCEGKGKSFYYKGYICHDELFDTIEEAIKNISKNIEIRDII
jgi:hypothetical protein